MHFTHFLILDDDPISGFINELAVTETVGRWSSKIFNNPIECLEYIKTKKNRSNFHTCLMLDINMPKLNGWEFLDEMQRLPAKILSYYTVVIVSSSYDASDRDRANAHPLVAGYLTKPVTEAVLKDYIRQFEETKLRA